MMYRHVGLGSVGSLCGQTCEAGDYDRWCDDMRYVGWYGAVGGGKARKGTSSFFLSFFVQRAVVGGEVMVV